VPDAAVIGREQERAAVDRFLADAASAPALVLSGEAGIGKTTLWEAGIATARERGLRVLAARPASAEIQLSFVALGDLLYGVEAEALGQLPSPQRHALEVAMLRAEPEGAPPEPRAIALALHGALDALAASAPVVVAIDDAQWLDPQSAAALVFAARRLTEEPVRFLIARRDDAPSPVEAAFAPDRVARIELGALSLGATRRLLGERLGLTLPRRVLRRVLEAAHGNPFVALELGRGLAERGVPEIGEELVLPESVEEVVGAPRRAAGPRRAAAPARARARRGPGAGAACRDRRTGRARRGAGRRRARRAGAPAAGRARARRSAAAAPHRPRRAPAPQSGSCARSSCRRTRPASWCSRRRRPATCRRPRCSRD
jgi:AAA ATPase-like protein